MCPRHGRRVSASPYTNPQEVCRLLAMTPRKTNTYVGLDPEELAIVSEVQREMRCSASAAIRALIRTAHASQLSSPRLSVEKENQAK